MFSLRCQKKIFLNERKCPCDMEFCLAVTFAMSINHLEGVTSLKKPFLLLC